MGNGIGATRLSRDTDSSTSIERQRETLVNAARLHEDKLICIAEDVDVSGSVSPFDRPEIGPWLTEADKLKQWDTLYVPKLDRLTRSVAHLDSFIKWCDANGKSLVSVAESLDLGTATGRMFAKMTTLFAEWERERMIERRADAARKLRDMGAWNGGTAPYGFLAERVGNQMFLFPDDAQAAVVRRMAAMILDGTAARAVGVVLNREGIPTMQGKRWDASGVIRLMRNPVLNGMLTHQGKVVTGEDGMPVRMMGQILDDATWAQLQDKLATNNTDGQREHRGSGMLYGALTCACGHPLFTQRRKNVADRYRHRDGNPCGLSFTAPNVDEAVAAALLDAVGDVRRVERTLIRGKGRAEQIARVEAFMAELDESFATGEIPGKAYGRMQARLEATLAEHMAHHLQVPEAEREDHYAEVPTSETYAEHWAGMTPEQRSKFLRDNGIRVIVGRDVVAVSARFALADARDLDADTPRVVNAVAKKAFIAVSMGSLSTLAEAVAS